MAVVVVVSGSEVEPVLHLQREKRGNIPIKLNITCKVVLKSVLLLSALFVALLKKNMTSAC